MKNMTKEQIRSVEAELLKIVENPDSSDKVKLEAAGKLLAFQSVEENINWTQN